MTQKLQTRFTFDFKCPNCGMTLPPTVSKCSQCNSDVHFDRDDFLIQWADVANRVAVILSEFPKKQERIMSWKKENKNGNSKDNM